MSNGNARELPPTAAVRTMVVVTESENASVGNATLPAGALTSDAVTDNVSPAFWEINDSVATAEEAVIVSAVVCVAVVAERVSESACDTAFDGTTDITPKPKAATVTSAIRLKVVFVDICFLSIVDLRTIRSSA